MNFNLESRMDMGGMDMGSSSNSTEAACQISMLWNWTTIDACFLSSQWHVRSIGGFVGTIIGIFFMVVALEGTRRLSREYDHSIRAAHFRRQAVVLPVNVVGKDSSSSSSSGFTPFWPSWQQQVVRSLFFGVQYGTGALLMLCLMYFNGYVVLFMFLGATVGYFLFARDLAASPDVGNFIAARDCC